MKLWKILGVELYEVGDVIITSSSNNPGSRFKGTWNLIAQGMAIVGVNPSDTDFNTVNKTGGSKTHTLTLNQIPAHSHNWAFGDNSQPVQSYKDVLSYGGWTDKWRWISATLSQTGGGQPHSIQSPYITKYIWERVS